MRTVADSGNENNSFLPRRSSGPKATKVAGRKSENLSGDFSPASSWRTRAASHYGNILELLRARGDAGVLSTELYDNPKLFGRSPRNRVTEMRRDGFESQTVSVSTPTVKYILRWDRAPQSAAENEDWYRRETGKPRAATLSDQFSTLLLSAGVR